jgi:hypothetical protein
MFKHHRLFVFVSLSAMVVGVLLASCNTNDFAGRTDKRPAAADDKDLVEPVTPSESNKPNVNDPNTNNNPSDPNDNETDTTGVVTIPPADKPSINIGEIISGFIKTLQEVEISQLTDTDIIFGGKKVFHVGDANFSFDSECALQIKAYRLKGTRYFFEFQILEPNTAVDIAVNKICGIDYNLTNTIHLQDATTDLDQKALAKQISDVKFDRKMLQPGKYMVVVESKMAGEQNPSAPNDFDDFIVGKVHIQADKPIKPGRVGAN